MAPGSPHPASYRDPAGHIFFRDKVAYRQVNEVYRAHYEMFMTSGLYDELTGMQMLITHVETDLPGSNEHAWAVLKPEQLDFLSYPYEWGFSQLRDAAILTLDIQSTAMEKGMSLKDATPFNIVFRSNKPVFIDTLSFETYDPSSPWVAYHQFCTCFLAPLLLAAYRSPDLIRMLATHPEGIPLQLCSSLLPWSSRFRPLAALHVHMPGGMKPGKQNSKQASSFSKEKLNHIISHLKEGIQGLSLSKGSVWSSYYEDTILSDSYLKDKERLVSRMLQGISFDQAFDAGCNTGQFSLVLARMGKKVISADSDPGCIDILYNGTKGKGLCIDSLLLDLMNPTPPTGWGNAERLSFWDRLKTDLILALALIHHLCLGQNLSFEKIATLFSRHAEWLLIEFIPKTDPRAQQILSNKEDIYSGYTEENFLHAFTEYFALVDRATVHDSSRSLFLLRRK